MWSDGVLTALIQLQDGIPTPADTPWGIFLGPLGTTAFAIFLYLRDHAQIEKLQEKHEAEIKAINAAHDAEERELRGEIKELQREGRDMAKAALAALERVGGAK